MPNSTLMRHLRHTRLLLTTVCALPFILLVVSFAGLAG